MTIAAGLIVSRLLHYLAVSVIFGAALFPLYATGHPALAAYRMLAWLPRLLLYAALLALASGILWLIFAAAGMRGSLAGAFDPVTLPMIVSQTNFGRLWAARLALAAGLAALLFLKPNRSRIYGVLFGSAILLVSLAGTGHTGADESDAAAIHVLADALHLLAAAMWIGALVVFVTMLVISRRTRLEGDATILHEALVRFSEIGGSMVVVLVFSGLMNPNVLASVGTRYGQVLLVKLILFGAMLPFAAANRFWLTPKLASALDAKSGSEGPIRALRASILAEMAIAVLVMAAVAWLGTLSPSGIGNDIPDLGRINAR